MSHYIIQALTEAAPEERNALAERLLINLSSHIPRGYYFPNDWDNQKEIGEFLAEQQAFYNQFESLLPTPPKIFIDLKKRFRKAARQMEKISQMSEQKRRNVPLYQWPEYAYDFDKAIKEQFYDKHGCISPLVQRARFFPKIIGEGGFGEVYLCKDGNKEYALKIAHPFYKWDEDFAIARRRIVGEIKQNLYQRIHLFKERPFTILQTVAPDNNFPVMCIMELFPGKAVSQTQRKKLVKDEELTTRVLRTYADALAFLHERDLLFLDNSWSNVLVSESDCAVCDYDFVSSPKELEEGRFKGICTRRTCSREQMLEKDFSNSSDLEGLALMIDQLYNYNEDSFVKKEEIEFEKNVKMAMENKRTYPKARCSRIPKKLQDVVTALITYPKDYSITIGDFTRVL